MNGRLASSVARALDPVVGLNSVTLEQLNAEAQLQTRVDRKYILPLPQLGAVLRTLPAGTRLLEHDDQWAPRYESHYFDTPELTSYAGAARGRRRRFKVRARRYVDSGVSFLEVKTRGGLSTTVKERMPLATDSPGRLDPRGTAYAAETLAAAGIRDADGIALRLRQELITAYRRVTLLIPGSGDRDTSRGTIDVDLAWQRPHANASLTLPAAVIVETKSGRQAGALDRALWAHGIRPTSLSKYGTGLAALDPSLPANRWRRVLDRHFRGEPIR
ncbi:VTC domain-containing protein [Microbacterium sp. LRZ72]|uniref:VTC domain-containing protein n=1 Tax=Microbacterium sp. LRZ72 TaxID=2942481 RepID=UPI0029A3D53B|nr:VTC domain-containing protein [Microbacterium sp. LRZ72]MDX2376531.1 VTC domain-containing protein [Microbacterium sp. LRZ72]